MYQPLCIAFAVFASSSLCAQIFPATPSWSFEGPNLNAMTGTQVGTAGDVNGDGHPDVCVYSWFVTGADTTGRVDVFHGDGLGLPVTPSWSFPTMAYSAVCIAGAGDLNGDGFDDFVIGDPGGMDVDGSFVHGSVRVFLGSPTGLPLVPDVLMRGENGGDDLFGMAVDGAGDVNGDGFADLVVGAALAPPSVTPLGTAYLYLGTALGLDTVPASTVLGLDPGERLGWTVAGAGDVNADGFADVIVAAPFYENGQQNEGRVCVFHGTPAGLDPTPAWVFESDSTTAHLGYGSIDGAGDVNGDGYDDIVVGSGSFAGATGLAGKVWSFLGGSGGLALLPAWSVEGGMNASQLGASIAGVGDVNTDGFDDMITGDNGHARVYLGSTTGFGPVPDWVADSPAPAGSDFGNCVGAAGDVNGDGRMDVIVGDPAYYVGGNDYASAAHVFYSQISTALAERSMDEVCLFPVPTCDQLQIRAPWPMEQWILIDASGRTVQIGQFGTRVSASIDLSAIAPGTYVLEVSGTDHRARRPLVVAR